MKNKKNIIIGLILGVVLFAVVFLAFEYIWSNIHRDLAMYRTNAIIIAAGSCSLAVIIMISLILAKKNKFLARGIIFSVLVSVGLVLVYSQVMTPFSLKRAREREKEAFMKMLNQTFNPSANSLGPKQ